MARKKGLADFNLALIRHLMRSLDLTVSALAEKIDYSESNLSKVLNRQSPLSEQMGKRLAEALGVSWEVVKKPEAQHMRELMSLWLVDFLQSPEGKLDWKNAVRLADKMGYLSGGVVDSSEPTDAENDDDDLLELGDVPEAEL